jgi:hypothetical protein
LSGVVAEYGFAMHRISQVRIALEQRFHILDDITIAGKEQVDRIVGRRRDMTVPSVRLERRLGI